MLITEQLFIRLAELNDVKLLFNYEEKNKELFQQWSTLDQLPRVKTKWEQRLMIWHEEMQQKKAARFLFFSKQNNERLLGMCNFTNIIFGPLQSCFLGFTVDAEFGSPEILKQALDTTITFMLTNYNLHRIMANYQPGNTKAGELLKSLGFKVEGYAYDYLLTERGWQDHILSSLLNNNWQPTR
jgi:ribosomal-protein-alanine N-acetyltransferase